MSSHIGSLQRTGLSTSGSISSASRLKSSRTTTAPRVSRPRTAISTLGGVDSQQIICALSESRGVSPTVGVAFLNLDTCEAILCQICDTQTYIRTMHKLHVYGPSEILIPSTAADPKSKLFSIVEDGLYDLRGTITLVDRRYWAETTGLEYLQQLALPDDAEALKIAASGQYFAVCCFAAVLKYVEHALGKTFPFHSLRIKYEPSEGSMMIDLSTMFALELLQNAHNPRSRDCLFGLLNETQTPMGSRLLRNNILQPVTNSGTLNVRYDALEELTTKEEMFFGVRQALKDFVDVDRLLTNLIIIPTAPSLVHVEQSINNIIMLRHFLQSIEPIFQALSGARSALFVEIRELCAPNHVDPIQDMIRTVINEDTKYSKQPLELRYQRTFAVKAGVNGLLDVSRTAFKECSDDAIAYAGSLEEEHGIKIELKFDNIRQYYFRAHKSEFQERTLPAIFINVVRKKEHIECSTLELAKRNQKIVDSHVECMLLGDALVQELIVEIRNHASKLLKISESIAMLDMISAFGQLVTSQGYGMQSCLSPRGLQADVYKVRPQLNDTLGVKSARHPIKEKIQATKFIPNDVYATQQSRFQIITGCNMSGKSTYIRTVALIAVMVQIGSFAPADYAAFPIRRTLFARVSVEDSIEANVSTFAAEMQEAAFILHDVDKHSLVIIDELGRGTSTGDGLAIAIAISEALIESRALVWFATHFIELGRALSERNGVRCMHLSVDMSNPSRMTMLYRLAPGTVEESGYGLALARVLPFPPSLLARAATVAEALDKNKLERKQTSAAVLTQRRRRLILTMHEHLVQAQQSNMQGATLKAWLQDLQREFVMRMTALEKEAARAGGSETDATSSVVEGVEGNDEHESNQVWGGAGPGYDL